MTTRGYTSFSTHGDTMGRWASTSGYIFHRQGGCRHPAPHAQAPQYTLRKNVQLTISANAHGWIILQTGSINKWNYEPSIIQPSVLLHPYTYHFSSFFQWYFFIFHIQVFFTDIFHNIHENSDFRTFYPFPNFQENSDFRTLKYKKIMKWKINEWKINGK